MALLEEEGDEPVLLDAMGRGRDAAPGGKIIADQKSARAGSSLPGAHDAVVAEARQKVAEAVKDGQVGLRQLGAGIAQRGDAIRVFFDRQSLEQRLHVQRA